MVALVLFGLDALLVVAGATYRIDLAWERAVQSIGPSPLTVLMEATNWVAGYKQWLAAVIVVAICLAACLLVWRSVRAAWILGASWVVSATLGALLKIVFGRPRPSPDLVRVLEHASGKSFPSGHAIFYGWLAGCLVLVIAPRLDIRLRPLAWVLAALLLVIGCLGRVWAGVHWPSDVVGGALLAIACVAIAAALPSPGPRRDGAPQRNIVPQGRE